jgi:hypothetical protein
MWLLAFAAPDAVAQVRTDVRPEAESG